MHFVKHTLLRSRLLCYSCINGVAFLQHLRRRSGSGSGSTNVGPILLGKTQLLLLHQQWEVHALKLGLRAATRLRTAAEPGPRQGRQHRALQCRQKSSLQRACLFGLPLLTEMRQPALSSRQHMQSFNQRLLVSRAKARLLVSRMTVPP